MARGINKHIIIGNVVRKPDVGTTKGDVSICTLTVACSEHSPNGEEVEFFDCIVFGNAAKFCGDYLDKGRCVYVEGRGRQRKFTDKNGNDRVKYEIKAFKVEALGSGRSENQTQPQGSHGDQPQGAGYGSYSTAGSDEGTPF
tara:strand:- start:14016 stop:14441 length:426 start_codon:yes stop_codon:yes gene_type:complete